MTTEYSSHTEKNLSSISDEIEMMSQAIKSCLANHNINVNVVNYSFGPVFTIFHLELEPGIKSSRIMALSTELSRKLAVSNIQILNPIPNTPYIGIQVKNKSCQIVPLDRVLNSKFFNEMPYSMTLMLGEDIAGQTIGIDLAQMPHLLITGTANSGKSVLLHTMILSLLKNCSQSNNKLLMIDTHGLELVHYNGIPQLISSVITDIQDAIKALHWCFEEMNKRYKLLQALGSRNIERYNQRIAEANSMEHPIPDPFYKPVYPNEKPPFLTQLPNIIIFIDGYSALFTGQDACQEHIIALSNRGHTAGIHLILTTRNTLPSIITNQLKLNIPARIALTVSSKANSRIIIDKEGAESLFGEGDMLFVPPNSSEPIRIQGAFVSDTDIQEAVTESKSQGKANYIDKLIFNNIIEALDQTLELDALFDQAVGYVLESRKPSISGIQRQFRIGYGRAAHIIEQMEEQGIVSPPDASGVRKILC